MIWPRLHLQHPSGPLSTAKYQPAAAGVISASLLIVLLIMAAAGLGGCGQGDAAETTQSSVGAAEFTLADLAGFDGKEGRPAYVAVDGVVYDVSASASWPQGQHSRCDLGAMAGTDLSETITKAPANMRSLLALMPVVGRLVE